MQKRIFLLLSILFMAFSSKAQKDRYKFAQTYIGFGTDLLVGRSSPEYFSGRILIGGTHFWQKADFYISFPAITTPLNPTSREYTEGVITGFRYLPLGLSRKKPGIILGLQWITPGFRNGDGPLFERSRLGAEGGLNLVVGSFYTLELTGHCVFNQDITYPDSRETKASYHLPDLGFSLALKKYFETTGAMSRPEIQKQLEERYKKMQARRALNAWSFGIGLSANITVADLPFLEAYSFLPNRPPIQLYPDIGIGHYWHEPDVYLRASWRPVMLSEKAYGISYESRQHRLSLEVFKFLFDYKGFVPFLGVNAGVDFIDSKLTDRESTVFDESENIPTAGITFGWDIRTHPSEAWLLRTNLRYSFQAKKSAFKSGANHLEVNFIQFVIYPERF